MMMNNRSYGCNRSMRQIEPSCNATMPSQASCNCDCNIKSEISCGCKPMNPCDSKPNNNSCGCKPMNPCDSKPNNNSCGCKPMNPCDSRPNNNSCGCKPMNPCDSRPNNNSCGCKPMNPCDSRPDNKPCGCQNNVMSSRDSYSRQAYNCQSNTMPSRTCCNHHNNQGNHSNCGCQPSREAITRPIFCECSCNCEHPAVTIPDREETCPCIKETDCLREMPIAMAYVPWQSWENVTDGCAGLNQGTIFNDAVLPFHCEGCKCERRCHCR